MFTSHRSSRAFFVLYRGVLHIPFAAYCAFGIVIVHRVDNIRSQALVCSDLEAPCNTTSIPCLALLQSINVLLCGPLRALPSLYSPMAGAGGTLNTALFTSVQYIQMFQKNRNPGFNFAI